MKFSKGEIIVSAEKVYPNGALSVDGYESDGTLLAHPIGGGFQLRFESSAEQKFRVVPIEEQKSIPWWRSTFEIEGVEERFHGWTNGERWNGWAMPHFGFDEARRVIELMAEHQGRFDANRDCFVTKNSDGEQECWEGRFVTLEGGNAVKVYGVGAGAWIWEERN